MGELSILTIVVSLAVCSILAVALYQYVNQRLSLAEHSQKEQAMILHQYIEESSYDIHCLKQQLSHAHDIPNHRFANISYTNSDLKKLYF